MMSDAIKKIGLNKNLNALVNYTTNVVIHKKFDHDIVVNIPDQIQKDSNFFERYIKNNCIEQDQAALSRQMQKRMSMIQSGTGGQKQFR